MIQIWYHANCYDGFGAAWSAWKKFGFKAKYVPVSYGDNTPEFESEDEIYIVDFSFPREMMTALNNECAKLVVLDHHKTAQKNLEGLEFCEFDMERSGAGMAWDYFHPHLKRPIMIDLLEDRDLWRFEYPYTKAFHAYIRSHPFDFLVWRDIAYQLAFDEKRTQIMNEGESILRSTDQTVAMMCQKSVIVKTDWGPAAMVNATCHWSEVGHHLLDKHPEAKFAISFCLEKPGTWMYSLRSTDERQDVSEVAEAFGGGGHRNAAGFKINQPIFSISR